MSAVFRRWLLAPKRSSKTLAAGRPHYRTRASCWKRLERENVHASVGLADVWTVLERGLLLDRLKRARRRDPRRKDADLAVAHVTSLMRNLKLESALQPKGPGAPLASPRAYMES